MLESDNHNKTVTSAELAKIIQLTQYGEYDQYHDWSPSYTFQDKANFLETMLKNWDKTEPDGKKLILQFIRTLVKESGSSALVITNILVFYAQFPEIINVVNASLNSGFFSHDLLISMKQNQIRREEWLMKIRDLTEGRKFIEKKRQINRTDLYKKIQELLLDLG